MAYEFRTANDDDVNYIFDHIRPGTLTEISEVGASLSGGREMVKARLVSHDTYVCLSDGVPLCLIGVEPTTMLGDAAVLWIMGSLEIERRKRDFWIGSKEILRYFASQYRVLTGVVWSGNLKSIKWLRRLGFVVQENPAIEVNATKFYSFWLVKEP